MDSPTKRRMEFEPVVSVTEAMERLQLSRQTVIREIKAKRIAASRMRWQYRIKLADLERYERTCARRAA